jgi:ATP-dependent DNA helicase 2 subunit 1
VQAFKDAVYGPQHDQEEADAAAERAKGSIASQKRKAAAEVACKESQNYDWGELADTGKVDILMSAQSATLLNDEQSNEVTYS